mgnify:CR=1 FL=1
MVGRVATQSDCANCAALCCIAYPSDDMPGFSAQKQSGEPCPKLDSCGACTIYDDRERLGFAGCIAFECFGAGQFVTRSVLAGGTDPGHPVTRQAMVDRFLRLRPAFDLLYLAQRLGNARLSRKDESDRASLVQLIEDALLNADPSDVERILPAAKIQLRELYSVQNTEKRDEFLNSH